TNTNVTGVTTNLIKASYGGSQEFLLTSAGNGTFNGTLAASNLSGTNTGDITLSGENYLSLSGQALTANAVNLGGSNVTGTLTLNKGGTNNSLTASNGGIV